MPIFLFRYCCLWVHAQSLSALLSHTCVRASCTSLTPLVLYIHLFHCLHSIIKLWILEVCTNSLFVRNLLILWQVSLFLSFHFSSLGGLPSLLFLLDRRASTMWSCAVSKSLHCVWHYWNAEAFSGQVNYCFFYLLFVIQKFNLSHNSPSSAG